MDAGFLLIREGPMVPHGVYRVKMWEGLLAKAVNQLADVSADTPQSGASPLPQGISGVAGF
ncbi:hypothetical protein DYL61_30775 [Pseudomonas nabeulensis]|uniref:Uncharacterized protein n=1 Tax=Pseudomonas nabeulensis TaxID=2293833 RepID=A0A4Z0AE91_9PSED|nr:hypothetical protein DYL61_30775 [Pseudomonas nabeulensis]